MLCVTGLQCSKSTRLWLLQTILPVEMHVFHISSTVDSDWRGHSDRPWWQNGFFQPRFPHLIQLCVNQAPFRSYSLDIMSHTGYISDWKLNHLPTGRPSCNTPKQQAFQRRSLGWRPLLLLLTSPFMLSKTPPLGETQSSSKLWLQALVFHSKSLQFISQGAALHSSPEFMCMAQRPTLMVLVHTGSPS